MLINIHSPLSSPPLGSHLSTSVPPYLPFSGILFVHRCLDINTSRIVVQLSHMVFRVLQTNSCLPLSHPGKYRPFCPSFSVSSPSDPSRSCYILLGLVELLLQLTFDELMKMEGYLGGHGELVSSASHEPPPSSLSSPPQSTSPPSGHQSCTDHPVIHEFSVTTALPGGIPVSSLSGPHWLFKSKPS